jgi:TIR domain
MDQEVEHISLTFTNPSEGRAIETSVLSNRRYELVEEFFQNGFTGIENLKKNGGFDHLTSRIPPLTENDVHIQESNALLDDFVSEIEVSIDALLCGLRSRSWFLLGRNKVKYLFNQRKLLRTDFNARSYRATIAGRRLLLIAFILLVAITAFLVITTLLPTLATWLTDKVPDTFQMMGEFAIVVFFVAFLFFSFQSSKWGQRSKMVFPRVEKGSLPMLLPLLLQPTIPRFMISYSWFGGFKITARTLARCLPNCWLDTRQLVSGDHIPTETTSVAAHCFCLIVLLTPAYLTSANCAAEICSAIFYRQPHQMTIVVMQEEDWKDEPVERIPKIKSLCESAGFLFVCSGRNTIPLLLRLLDRHVLHVSHPLELKATVEWWRIHSRPLLTLSDESGATSLTNGVQLMSPMQRKRGSRCSITGRCCRPRGGVVAGTDYLSGTASYQGKMVRVTSQQRALVISFIFTALLIVYPFLYCFSSNLECHKGSPYFWGPTITISLIAFTAFELISGLDARTLHDAILLPLNVAAYMNEDEEGRKLLGSFGVCFIKERDSSLELNRQVRTLQHFLADIAVGLPCSDMDLDLLSVIAQREFGSADSPIVTLNDKETEKDSITDGKSQSDPTLSLNLSGVLPGDGNLNIYLFFLHSEASVRKWAAIMQTDPNREKWNSSNMIIIGTGEIFRYKVTPPIGQFLVLVYGKKEGIDEASPYESMMQAIIDNIGRKIGSVFTSDRMILLSALESGMQINGSKRSQLSARLKQRKSSTPSSASLNTVREIDESATTSTSSSDFSNTIPVPPLFPSKPIHRSSLVSLGPVNKKEDISAHSARFGTAPLVFHAVDGSTDEGKIERNQSTPSIESLVMNKPQVHKMMIPGPIAVSKLSSLTNRKSELPRI